MGSNGRVLILVLIVVVVSVLIVVRRSRCFRCRSRGLTPVGNALRLHLLMVLDHGGVHLQREVAEDVVVDFEHALEASDQRRRGVKNQVDVIPIAPFAGRVGEAPCSPFSRIAGRSGFFLDVLGHTVDDALDLVVLQHRVNDGRKLGSVLSVRHGSLWDTRSDRVSMPRAHGTEQGSPKYNIPGREYRRAWRGSLMKPHPWASGRGA